MVSLKTGKYNEKINTVKKSLRVWCWNIYSKFKIEICAFVVFWYRYT